MNIFVYDRSFEGLLTAIYESYYTMMPDNILSIYEYENNLIDSVINIESNLIKYKKVENAIINKLGNDVLEKVFYVYLSNEKNKEKIILEYILLAFKLNRKILMYKQNEKVIAFEKVARKVALEIHRFKGFVRFKEVNNILYSKINPENDILEMLINHFKKRFSKERFIIHDEIRKKAVVYNIETIKVVNIENNIELEIQDSNVEYEKLWKNYFNSLSIKERENKTLQRKNMPKKYWSNLTEIQ